MPTASIHKMRSILYIELVGISNLQTVALYKDTLVLTRGHAYLPSSNNEG